MNKYAQQSREARKLRKLRRMCLDKKAYATAEAAFQKGQNIYQCRHCGQWHRTGQAAQLAAELKTRRP